MNDAADVSARNGGRVSTQELACASGSEDLLSESAHDLRFGQPVVRAGRPAIKSRIGLVSEVSLGMRAIHLKLAQGLHEAALAASEQPVGRAAEVIVFVKDDLGAAFCWHDGRKGARVTLLGR